VAYLGYPVLLSYLTSTTHSDNAGVGTQPHPIDSWLFLRQLTASVSVDPFYRRIFICIGSLCDEVVDVGAPVLERGISDLGALLGDDLDYCGVKRILGIDRGCAALNILNISVVVCDDERSLELSHVRGVDSEICL